MAIITEKWNKIFEEAYLDDILRSIKKKYKKKIIILTKKWIMIYKWHFGELMFTTIWIPTNIMSYQKKHLLK